MMKKDFRSMTADELSQYVKEQEKEYDRLCLLANESEEEYRKQAREVLMDKMSALTVLFEKNRQ